MWSHVLKQGSPCIRCRHEGCGERTVRRFSVPAEAMVILGRRMSPSGRSPAAGSRLSGRCCCGTGTFKSRTAKELFVYSAAHRSSSVLDADALNLIAEDEDSFGLPGRKILTPHVGGNTRLLH